MDSATKGKIARFGVFEADLERRRLTKSGFRIRLQDQPFQILTLLLERPGEVVPRERIKDTLWAADTFVAFDDGLNTAIKKLRAALSDSPDNPRFVETVPRVGYRFIAPVTVTEVAADTPPVRPLEMAPEVLGENGIPFSPDPSPAPSPGSSSPVEHARIYASRRSGVWRWLVVALVTLLLAGWFWRTGTRAAGPGSPGRNPIKAIAVLPLQNTSADPALNYLADGMTDEIITDLAKLAGPKVISRTSAMQYKATRKNVPEIARELHVGAIVEGSVERSPDRLRVRVQLIDAATDQHMWAESYDRQLSDELQLEADLAKDIAREIQVHLTTQQQHTLANVRPTNPQAFQDYLQGRHYWATRSEEGLHKAVDYFNRAIAEDPGDARSYAGLAHCYIVLPLLYNVPQAEAYAKAGTAAAKALELDDSLAEAHLAMAEVLLQRDWDFAGAEREFQRTLALNPNYATGHQWYGEFLSFRARHDESIRELETTLALDPLSPIVHHQAGQTDQQARQYDRAIAEYNQAVQLNPTFVTSYESMSWAYRRQGKYAEAIDALQHGLSSWERDYPGVTAALAKLDAAYKREGKACFLRKANEFHRLYARPSLYMARDYADLGEKEKAYAWLERTYQNHDLEMLFVFIDPEFEGMRGEARFQELLRRIEKK